MIGTLIKKLGLFLVLGVLMIESVAFLLLKTNLFLVNYSGSEIYHALGKSHKVHSSKKLLIGDSVANQLFPNDEKGESINSLACNQAVSMAGHYVLVKNYLEAGNDIDTLIGLFTPFSLRTNLDQVYTYHCFIKPFYIDRYMENYSDEVIRQVQKIPFHSYAQVPHIKATTWAPKYTAPGTVTYPFLSPITKEYLVEIRKLAEEHDFIFKIVPTPVSISSKEEIDEMLVGNKIPSEVSEIFDHFFDQIIFLDSTQFYDGTHLKEPEEYSKKYKRHYFDPVQFR